MNLSVLPPNNNPKPTNNTTSNTSLYTQVSSQTEISEPLPNYSSSSFSFSSSFQSNLSNSSNLPLLNNSSNNNTNKITIHSYGKIRSYVNNVLKSLKEPYSSVVLWGQGVSINKTVTIVEILKRKFNALDIPFDQINQIGQIQQTKTYSPSSEKLDSLKAIKHTPYLTITLKMHEMGAALLLELEEDA